MPEEAGLRIVASGDGQGADDDDSRLKRYEIDWTILMARAQDGDAEAYRRLLQEITPFLRYKASRFHRDQRDIEDTVQDVLLSIHSVRHTYDPQRSFGPWLMGIANRRAFDRLKRQGRQRLHEVQLTGDHQDLRAAEISDETTLDRRNLADAIAKLPPAQREAIRALKLEELSLKEASSKTGMSIVSLKVATHRALKGLRAILSDRGETS